MFKPQKKLGQNFLKNDQIALEIVKAAEIDEKDTILEVGPGTGILTEKLVKTGAPIFAIEKDFDLISKLKKNLGEPKNLKIVHQDVLWFDHALIKNPYKVVANIPYNITSPLIRKFLESDRKPELLVLMVQKEVAERICARPGDSNRGLLTLIVEFYAEAELLFKVSRREFYPSPNVDSAVIRLKIKSQKKDIDEALFFKIVKAGFAAKRRQIHNSLAATMRWSKEETLAKLKKAEIAENLRAEDLTFEDWLKLYYVIQTNA